MLKGFIIGLALTIMVGQLPKFFGFEKTSGDFFEQLWGWITHLGDTSLVTLGVGLASLVVVLGFCRFLPVVPGSLAAARLTNHRGPTERRTLSERLVAFEVVKPQ